MKRPVFKSSFSKAMNEYLDFRSESDIKPGRDYTYLKKLDRFLSDNNIKVFTKSVAEEWRHKTHSESQHGYYLRINVTKRLMHYLHTHGYDVALFRDVKPPTPNYTPHIYTDEEISSYFRVLDTIAISNLEKHRIQLPIFFRILYCCGTRVTETLSIKKKDVNIEHGIITLHVTKGNKERYVVMSESLRQLMQVYADKTFAVLNEDSPIFSNKYGLPLTEPSIHHFHRKILALAGIPAASSSGNNKRIHDWRHTFAVRSFKKMIDDGRDLYVSLPILSAYLGHRNIRATEYYIRLTSALYPYVEDKFQNIMQKIQPILLT